jgi:hypothetical protein
MEITKTHRYFVGVDGSEDSLQCYLMTLNDLLRPGEKMMIGHISD